MTNQPIFDISTPPPPPPQRQYYISRDGQAVGPYERSALADLILRGEITDADIVWFEGAAEWVPISSVRGEIVAAGASPSVHSQPLNASASQSAVKGLDALKQRIQKAMNSHSGYKKAFTGEKLSDDNTKLIAKTFEPLNPHKETILFAGLYKAAGKPLGIVITGSTLYYRLTKGFFGFAKKGRIALRDINAITAEHTLIHACYGGGSPGPEISINGKPQGWIQLLWLMSDENEQLLIDLLNDINSSGCLLRLR